MWPNVSTSLVHVNHLIDTGPAVARTLCTVGHAYSIEGARADVKPGGLRDGSHQLGPGAVPRWGSRGQSPQKLTHFRQCEH